MWNLLKSSQEMRNIFSPENFKFYFRNNCRGIKYWRKGWNATFITLSSSLHRRNIHYYYFPFTTILKLFIERKIANGVKNVSTCNFKILFKWLGGEESAIFYFSLHSTTAKNIKIIAVEWVGSDTHFVMQNGTNYKCILSSIIECESPRSNDIRCNNKLSVCTRLSSRA